MMGASSPSERSFRLLHTSGYTSQVEVGDWILCNAMGDVSSMPDWEFQALMEPAPPSEQSS